MSFIENTEMKRQIEYFECACHCPAHTIRLEYDHDLHGQNISFCYYLDLSHIGFFKRIWLALKIIFRASNLDYCFHDVIIKNEDIPRLRRLLEKVQNRKRVKENVLS